MPPRLVLMCVISVGQYHNTMVSRRREWFLGLAIAVASLLYYLSYAGAFLDKASLNDEGFAMYGAVRVMQGQRPLVDFWSYPPGRYWLLAWAMSQFGVSVLTHRALLAALLALKNALAFGVARRVMPTGPAIAVALTVALVPGPWHKVYYSLLMFAQLLLLIHYLQRPTALRSALCGLAAAAAFYFRQDSAAYGLAACAVMFTIALLPRGAWRPWLAHNLLLLAAFLLALLPLAIIYADDWSLTLRRLGPDPVLVAEAVYQRVHFMQPATLWRRLLANLTHWPDRAFISGFFPWAALAIAALAAASLLPWTIKLKRLRPAQLAWAALVLWSLLSLTKVYKQPNLEAVLMAGQGTVLIAGAVAWWLYFRWTRRPSHALLSLATWTILAFAWAHLLALTIVPVADLETGAWSASRVHGQTARLRTHLAPLDLEPHQARALNRTIAYVRKHTTADQTIHAWQHPMLYVLCERNNALATESIVPASVLPDWQDHYRQVFTQYPPALQILNTQSNWINRLREYPQDLQWAVFAGYAVALDTGDYLVLKYTGQGNAHDTVIHRLTRKKR